MIPLRDNIPSRTTPLVGYVMIAICAGVFLLQLQNATLVESLGMIPARVVDPHREIIIEDRAIARTPAGDKLVRIRRPAAEALVPAWLTPLTCMFLHGGWLHIIGNLWFLHIFGDNVEDRYGRWGFLLLYLGCGVLSSLAHLASDPGSMMPTIGASGAIAGVMGAYFVLYPRAKVLMLIPIVFIFYTVVVPAPVFLGIWFLLQLLQGSFAIHSGVQAGVAWWAHIGGFAVGAAVTWILMVSNRLRPAVTATRPNTANSGYYRIRLR